MLLTCPVFPGKRVILDLPDNPRPIRNIHRISTA